MAERHATYEERIVSDPTVMLGKPVVKGTRIPVEAVLAHLADNPDLDDLFGAYPRLTKEDVMACLAFAEASVEQLSRRPFKPRSRKTQPAAL